MMRDTSSMDPLTKEWWKIKKSRILEKKGKKRCW
jgi:hypothetical protein